MLRGLRMLARARPMAWVGVGVELGSSRRFASTVGRWGAPPYAMCAAPWYGRLGDFPSRRMSSSTGSDDGGTPPQSADGGSTIGEQLHPRLAITFTCNVCEARQQKTFTKHSYEKGVVIISCDGCSTKHLIADNLGWFADVEGKNIEEILAAKGEGISKDGDHWVEYGAKDLEDTDAEEPWQDTYALEKKMLDGGKKGE